MLERNNNKHHKENSTVSILTNEHQIQLITKDAIQGQMIRAR